jgi:D-threonate/D-erythronate kinase
MIAVIADDLTGAAEIAGIGLRYGLKVELKTSVVAKTAADLFVVCTDSRSMSKSDAEKVTANTVKEILLLKPDLIYKKIDSVLRGYVLDELNVQMQVTGLTRAFVLSANPSLGRTMRNGLYYINGKPISETGFAADPEFAITDSAVLKMIRAQSGGEKVLRQPDELPSQGIVIGEAETTEEVAAWAERVDEGWVLAGAGDFFTALLNERYKLSAQPEVKIRLPHLYVGGTAFEKSKAFIREIKERSGCVVYMPVTMMQSGNTNDPSWLDCIKEIIVAQGKCIIAIEENQASDISALSLRNTMASAVRKIIEEAEIKELFIEGGSTAAAILNELDFTTLVPVNELQRGVVRMKAGDLYITMKPGSYALPEQITRLYS